MAFFSRVLRAVRELVAELTPEPSLRKTLAQVDTLRESLRAELGNVIASSHLAAKRLAELERERAPRIEAALAAEREAEAHAQVALLLVEESEQAELERELADARAHQAKLEQLLAVLLATREELQRELTNPGDSSGTPARDPLDSAARERRIRDRLRELQAKRNG